MDFFERQTRARKESRRLVWLFGLTLLAVLAVNNRRLWRRSAARSSPPAARLDSF
jgi:hypothetical protein